MNEVQVGGGASLPRPSAAAEVTHTTNRAPHVTPAMAAQLATIASQIDQLRTQRDALIVQAHQAGATLREIGALAGLTHGGVRDILRRNGL